MLTKNNSVQLFIKSSESYGCPFFAQNTKKTKQKVKYILCCIKRDSYRLVVYQRRLYLIEIYVGQYIEKFFFDTISYRHCIQLLRTLSLKQWILLILRCSFA